MSVSAPNKYSQQIKLELDELELVPVNIDGKAMKPSQCYHFSTNPPHVLFNTNCPDELKKKVASILSKYSQDADAAQA